RLDAVDVLQALCIDHIDSALSLHDAHVHEAAVGTDGDVVGTSTERNLLDDLEACGVNHIEGQLRFAAEVKAAAVRRRRGPVVDGDAADLVHHALGRRIDEVNHVAARVRLHY